jgi:hypothetical protein
MFPVLKYLVARQVLVRSCEAYVPDNQFQKPCLIILGNTVSSIAHQSSWLVGHAELLWKARGTLVIENEFLHKLSDEIIIFLISNQQIEWANSDPRFLDAT